MDLKEKRLVVIKETVTHFNINNRSVSLDDGRLRCMYAPVHGISDGCAIGRMIQDKDICREMDKRRAYINHKKLDDIIPQDIKDLGMDFLYALQSLHDDKLNWNENGLSERGRDCSQLLVQNYCA